jgi:hypothetical protein
MTSVRALALQRFHCTFVHAVMAVGFPPLCPCPWQALSALSWTTTSGCPDLAPIAIIVQDVHSVSVCVSWRPLQFAVLLSQCVFVSVFAACVPLASTISVKASDATAPLQSCTLVAPVPVSLGFHLLQSTCCSTLCTARLRSLYENEIGDAGCEYLKEGLKSCATLNKLVLSYNQITDEVSQSVWVLIWLAASSLGCHLWCRSS